MKGKLSALIVLLANIGILVHAAIPHFHGDDMYATFAHIASHSVIAGSGHSDCDHDGDTEKRPASEHCVLNDTNMPIYLQSKNYFANLLLCGLVYYHISN